METALCSAIMDILNHERDMFATTNVIELSGSITTVITIAERLKAAREDAGLTQEDVATAAGVAQGTVANIESGIRKNPRELLAIAKAVNVHPEWLKSGRGPRELVTPLDINQVIDVEQASIALINNPDYPSIRRVKFKLSAGCSGFSVEYAQDSYSVPFVFPREWYEKHHYRPDALFAVGVANGSMEPGLFDGDTVVVNTADVTIKDGKVYAMNYEGELVIKRMVRDAGQWWLTSDNPDQRRYPRKVCSDDVFCVGRIVHKQSETI
jgi:phage repressor protein C with HTH and peptisase S24 domain